MHFLIPYPRKDQIEDLIHVHDQVHMEGMCQNVVKKRIMLTARDEPEALILTVEDVVATEGGTVVLLSTNSVVGSPAPPSTVEAVEAAALALACDVLNVNVASRVVSAEKLGSASLRKLLSNTSKSQIL